MKTYKPHASSVGDAAANTISVACYLCMLLLWSFGFIPILILFFMEKKSGLVRFHAMQAFMLYLVNILFGGAISYEGFAALITGNVSYFYGPMGWMSGLGVVLARAVIEVLVLVFAIVAIAKALRWQDWRVPLVGLLAATVVGRCRSPIYNGEGPVPHGCERGVSSARKPEWRAKWDSDFEPYAQQMLSPPPKPKPVLEAIREVEEYKDYYIESSRTRNRITPPPQPIYDDSFIKHEYTLPASPEPEVRAPEVAPVAVQTEMPAPAETAVPEVPVSVSMLTKAMNFGRNPNDQLPDYMRDPDPVTGWMEAPMPEYPTAAAEPIEVRYAAPVPQNVRTKKPVRKIKTPSQKKKRKDDPNNQLPPDMRDPSPFYD